MPPANGSQFQHLQLALHHKGRAKLYGRGGSPSLTSVRNLADRPGHAQRLRMSLASMRAMWRKLKDDRAAQALPALPNAMPIFLRVDPKAFDPDRLEGFGLELVMEHDEGFLLCASQDEDLQAFEDKINAFLADKLVAPARVYSVDPHTPSRAELVVGSSLSTRLRTGATADGISVDVSVVLATHSFRHAFGEPKKREDPEANLAARMVWRAKVQTEMQQWTALFVERVQSFAAFVRQSAGQLLDRQDVHLFLSAQPTELRLMTDLAPEQADALTAALQRPCRVLATYGASGSATDPAQGEALIRIPVTGLPPLPPEPSFEALGRDPERYEPAWEAWVAACGCIRNEHWIPMLADLRRQVHLAVEQLGGDIRSLTGDDVDRLQAPDQVVVTARLPLNAVATLSAHYPYIAFVDLIPPVSPTEAVPDLRTDPDVPAMIAPPADAPSICVIDSGLEADHPIIGPAIAPARCVSFIPGDSRGDYDPAPDGGHGTRVAGAVCFPDGMPMGQPVQAVAWLQGARILDEQNQMPPTCAAEMTTWRAVRYAVRNWGTRIFNLSINYCDVMELHGQARMDSWSSHLDWISANEDVLIIASAGNIPASQFAFQRQRLQAQRQSTYPATMAQMPCHLTPPALSWNAVVVGSICPDALPQTGAPRVGQPLHPSPFSRGGPGLWRSTKPDVVEIAGDWVEHANRQGSPVDDPGVMLTLPQSTHAEASPKAPAIGTSFAAPKVARVAAEIARAVRGAPPVLIRTLIIHSARWPEWMERTRPEAIAGWMAHMGYGVPSIERATTNDPFRVTYITTGLDRIKAGEVQAWTIPIHPEIRRGHDVRIRIDVTTCCCPMPRPTRRGRHYGSIWVDWRASSRGQSIESFLESQSKDVDAPEGAEEGSSLRWTLGVQERQGFVQGVTGSAGSVHRDWAELAADELPQDLFGVAVRGHTGWDTHPDASVPYALAVTFTVLGQAISIYALQAQAQAQAAVPVQAEVGIRVPG